MSGGLRVVVLLAAAAGPLVAAGCGSKGGDANDPDVMRRRADLSDIFDMYTMFIKRNQKPPQRVADLAQKNNQTLTPMAAQGLQSEEYVVIWGAEVTGKENSVLAYHKSVPAEGGMVLLRNGTIKHMTADEFKAAPKDK
jgi:hypothetical protein